MAPPGIVDYIVVHELCHLIQRDHSRKFWDLVGSILPDFKKRKKWLKENGLKLEI
jgi:predicted metal-dependent hydrolase